MAKFVSELQQQGRPWALAIKNLCFPIFCLNCSERLLDEENGFFCPTCWELAPRIEAPLCPSCGRPHVVMVGLGSRRNFLCEDCREAPHDAIGRIYGAAMYEGVIAKAIQALKFNDRYRLSRPLGELMKQFAVEYMDVGTYDWVVPVPLHRVRLRDRGYNQSRLLATEIMPAFYNAQLSEDLKRIRPTRTQSKVVGKMRADNVRGAFAVAGDPFSDARVLLVDDVVTSGGTVCECARTLLRAGAARVDVFAAALVEHRVARNRIR
jgi:ComF family protein